MSFENFGWWYLKHLRSPVPYFRDLYYSDSAGLLTADPRMAGVGMAYLARPDKATEKAILKWNSTEYMWPSQDCWKLLSYEMGFDQFPGSKHSKDGYYEDFGSTFDWARYTDSDYSVAGENDINQYFKWSTAPLRTTLYGLLSLTGYDWPESGTPNSWWYSYRQSFTRPRVSSHRWLHEASHALYEGTNVTAIYGTRGAEAKSPSITTGSTGSQICYCTVYEGGARTINRSTPYFNRREVQRGASPTSWSNWYVADLLRSSPRVQGISSKIATYIDLRASAVLDEVTYPSQVIPSDGRLTAGQSISTANGKHVLIYQTDGNLVLYTNGSARWASNTSGRSTNIAVMQTDGNFVVYDAANVPRYYTSTQGTPGAYLELGGDGSLVIKRADGSVRLTLAAAVVTTSIAGKSFSLKLYEVPQEVVRDIAEFAAKKLTFGLGIHQSAPSGSSSWGLPSYKVTPVSTVSLSADVLTVTCSESPSGLPSANLIAGVRLVVDTTSLVTDWETECYGSEVSAASSSVSRTLLYADVQAEWAFPADSLITPTTPAIVTHFPPPGLVAVTGWEPGGRGCYATNYPADFVYTTLGRRNFSGISWWCSGATGDGPVLSFQFSDGAFCSPSFPWGAIYLPPTSEVKATTRLVRTMRGALECILAHPDGPALLDSLGHQNGTKPFVCYLEDGRIAVYDNITATIEGGLTEKALIGVFRTYNSTSNSRLTTAPWEVPKFGWVSRSKSPELQISGGYDSTEYGSYLWAKAGAKDVVRDFPQDWTTGWENWGSSGVYKTWGVCRTRYEWGALPSVSEWFLTTIYAPKTVGSDYRGYVYERETISIGGPTSVGVLFASAAPFFKVYGGPDIQGLPVFGWFNYQSESQALYPEVMVSHLSCSGNSPLAVVEMDSTTQVAPVYCWGPLDTAARQAGGRRDGFKVSNRGNYMYGEDHFTGLHIHANIAHVSRVGDLSGGCVISEFRDYPATSYEPIQGNCGPDVRHNGATAVKPTAWAGLTPLQQVKGFDVRATARSEVDHRKTRHLTKKGIWEPHLGKAKRITTLLEAGPLALLLCGGRLALQFSTDRFQYDEKYSWNNTWNLNSARSGVSQDNCFVALLGSTCKVVHAGGDLLTSFNEEPSVGTITGDTYTPKAEGWDRITVIDTANHIPVCITVMVCNPGCLPVWDDIGSNSGSKKHSVYTTSTSNGTRLYLWNGVFARGASDHASSIVGPMALEDLPATSYFVEAATLSKYPAFSVRFLGNVLSSKVGSVYHLLPPAPNTFAAGSGHGPVVGSNAWAVEVMQSPSGTSTDFSIIRPGATAAVVRSGRGWFLNLGKSSYDLMPGQRIGFRIFHRTLGIFQITDAGVFSLPPASAYEPPVEPEFNVGFSPYSTIPAPPIAPNLPASAPPNTEVSV